MLQQQSAQFPLPPESKGFQKPSHINDAKPFQRLG